MKTSSSRTVRSHFPHGKKSSAVGKLSGQWLELCRYVPLVTGAALLVAGCSNNTPQVYDYEAIDRAAAQATHSLTPWERYQQRSVARELADDRERAESARSVPEAPAASSSSWGLISPA